jgi:hypothetical protein
MLRIDVMIFPNVSILPDYTDLISDTHLADGTATPCKLQGQSTSIGPHLKGLLFAPARTEGPRAPSAAHWAPADLPAKDRSAVGAKQLRRRRLADR